MSIFIHPHGFVIHAPFVLPRYDGPWPCGHQIMPIIIWIITLVIPTIRSVHLQIYCSILRSHHYTLPVPFSMVLERHPSIRHCFMERTYVCHHCRNHLIPEEPILAKLLLPTLHVQLENCAEDNKCWCMFCYWTLLVPKVIFKGEFVLFFIVGHMHDDINASIGRWRMKLNGEVFLPFYFSWNHTWIWTMCW